MVLLRQDNRGVRFFRGILPCREDPTTWHMEMLAGASSFLGTRDREGTSNPSCVALGGKVGGPCRCAILPVPASCKAAREEAGLPV